MRTLLLILLTSTLSAQQVYFGEPACVGEVMALPVNSRDLTDVWAVSLQVSYDTTKFTYITCERDPIFIGWVFAHSGNGGNLNAGLFNITSGVNPEHIVTFYLLPKGGCCPLDWQPMSEIAGMWGIPQVVTFNNGYICDQYQRSCKKEPIQGKFNILGQQINESNTHITPYY